MAAQARHLLLCTMLTMLPMLAIARQLKDDLQADLLSTVDIQLNLTSDLELEREGPKQLDCRFWNPLYELMDTKPLKGIDLSDDFKDSIRQAEYRITMEAKKLPPLRKDPAPSNNVFYVFSQRRQKFGTFRRRCFKPQPAISKWDPAPFQRRKRFKPHDPELDLSKWIEFKNDQGRTTIVRAIRYMNRVTSNLLNRTGLPFRVNSKFKANHFFIKDFRSKRYFEFRTGPGPDDEEEDEEEDHDEPEAKPSCCPVCISMVVHQPIPVSPCEEPCPPPRKCRETILVPEHHRQKVSHKKRGHGNADEEDEDDED
mmetsp:Transcript_12628/g.18904  ORF Transcript_12628/g.18904 Transcript_12628/m.18904 type:complete len:312 (-) Transcript_12628:240-1175(-)